jgi:hypothetical protein
VNAEDKDSENTGRGTERMKKLIPIGFSVSNNAEDP